MRERETAALIGRGVERYDAAISSRDSYELFYNLSSLRTAALCWLPFAGTETVLDAGCGYGALTGYLCDKAAHVDAMDRDPACTAAVEKRYAGRNNLRVITGDLRTDLPQTAYDMILLIDVLEWYDGDLSALFAALKARLAPGGRLLVGFRNRFALRYACGLTDELVTEPGAAFDPTVPLHTDTEVRAALAGAGLSVRRTYYPLPDLVFTQAVWSDAWLPQGSVKDRILTCDPFGRGDAARARREHAAWDTAVREGRLAEVSNCYLMDCTDDPSLKWPVGAVLSADREPAHAFATVFYDGGTVTKRALHPEGISALRGLYDNLEALRGRGLAVVEQEWGKEADAPAIRMPLLHHQPLLEHIRDLFKDGKEAVYALFDALYAEILRASEPSDAPAAWELSACPGPVLRTGYVDMIPYNAFWTGGRRRQDEGPRPEDAGGSHLLWYDQEFTLENCPAAYILYRALRYTWLHLPEAEAVLPLKEAAAHYGLTGCWAACTAYEDAFTGRNRSRDTYAQLYRWAWGTETAGTDAGEDDAQPGGAKKPYHTGLCMGTFDLFHTGHLNLLRRAKEHCEFLRVGVLSDELVQKYKGITPNIPLDDRLAVVRAVRYVDEAVPVTGDYVSKVAEWHKRPYDCFFSGDDYADNAYWQQEKAELEKLGATIVFFPYTREISSSMIRRHLNGADPAQEPRERPRAGKAGENAGRRKETITDNR